MWLHHLLSHWAIALLTVLFTIVASPRPVNARTAAIRVAASPHWLGLTGNWSTFQVSIGSPGQAVELTVSTTTSRLIVLERTYRDDNVTIFYDGPGFAPEKSTSWSGIDPPKNLAYKGSDMIYLSVTNSTSPTLNKVGIDVTNRSEPLSTGLGSIGLGILDDVYNNTSIESLISQLHDGGPDNIPSPSYGYTAGASYANGKGVLGSLTLGGYDSVRFPNGTKSPLTLYNHTTGMIPALKVVGIELVPNEAPSNSDQPVKYTLSGADAAFLTVMDPSTPYLWFPEIVCEMFAKQFNLTWNEELQLYLFGSQSPAKQFAEDRSRLFHFEFADQGDGNYQTTILISPLAFALVMKVSSSSSGFQELPYFPLKRGRAENGEYTIGRAFFQEVYLLTDFSERTFYIGQAIFPENPATNFSIVDVVPLSGQSQERGLSAAQVGGIVGGAVALLMIVLLSTYLILRHLRAVQRAVNSTSTDGKMLAMVVKPLDINNHEIDRAPRQLLVRGSYEDLVRDLYRVSPPQAEGGRNVRPGPEFSEDPLRGTVAESQGSFDVTGLLGVNTGAVSPPSCPVPLIGSENSSRLTRSLPTTGGSKGPIQTNDTRDSGEPRKSDEGSASTKSVSASDSSVVAPTMEIYKQRAVDSLMAEFKSLLSHGPHVGLSIRAGGRDSVGSFKDAGAGSKHGRDETAADGSSVEGDGAGAIKKARVNLSHGPRFACPYYRRNPKKHLRHRACAGPGWAEVRRVKEHVYRTHALPMHCHRCGVIMNSDADLRAHQRQPEGCEVRIIDLPEGFDKKQEEELRKKKHGETEEDKWYAMYKILFPDEDGDLVPSPYYHDNLSDAERQHMDELKQYERFQRRELLRAVRRLLEDSVSGMAGPLEDQLRTQFVDIVRQAQSEVFQAYRGSGDSGKVASTACENGGSHSTDPVPRDTDHEAQRGTDSPGGSRPTITSYLPPASSAELDAREHYPDYLDTNLGTETQHHGSLFLDEATLQTVLEMGSTPFIPSGFKHNHQPDFDARAPTIYCSNSRLGYSQTEQNTSNVDFFQSESDPISTTTNDTGAESGVMSKYHMSQGSVGGHTTVTHEATITTPCAVQGTVDEFVASLGDWDGIFS